MSAYNCSPVTGGCDENFASLDGFDSHLVPHMGRPAECRDRAWLKANGYGLNKFGEWFHVAEADRARRNYEARTSPGGGPHADAEAGVG